ncbi:hypothetical protein [Gemmatimonas sp.]
MDTFKREHFEKAHPGESFPPSTALSVDEAEQLKVDLAVRLGGMPTDAAQKIARDLVDEALVISGANATEPAFDLCGILDDLGLERPEDVLINWRHFDDVDRMRLTDLRDHFADIWYPSSDDIEIIHPSRRWVISVSHDGDVSYLRFS